ncbi:hypothetical protein ACFJIV_19405 [Mucilaginibacter sp. UC70_90]
MKTFKLHIYIVAGLLLLGACKPEVHTPKPSSGTVDFSRFISLGNSLTAGYADGGLYLAGQQVSYPSIIGKQMQSVGGGRIYAAAIQHGTGKWVRIFITYRL